MEALSCFRICRKKVFFSGFAIGAIIAFIFHKREPIPTSTGSCVSYKRKLPSYKEWFEKKDLVRSPIDFDAFIYGNSGGMTEALFLEKEVNILCAVFVQKLKNARAVNETWGKHCNVLEYFSMIKGHDFPLVFFQSVNSFHFLCSTINYIADKFKNIHWVLFVRDDMFVIPENLRYYVAPLDYNVPYYLGHPLMFWGQVYNVAEAGYVLSKAALLAVKMKFNTTEKCQNAGKYWKNEDFYLGKHLRNMGIFPKDTRDGGYHGHFHGNGFNQLLFPGRLSKLSSYWKKSVYPQLEGFGCCSNKSITFHGVEGDKLYFLEYLVYRLQIFNSPCIFGKKPAPTPFPDEQVWQQFLLSEGKTNFTVSGREYFELWQNKIAAPDTFNERLRKEHMNNDATAIGIANLPILESVPLATESEST